MYRTASGECIPDGGAWQFNGYDGTVGISTWTLERGNIILVLPGQRSERVLRGCLAEARHSLLRGQTSCNFLHVQNTSQNQQHSNMQQCARNVQQQSEAESWLRFFFLEARHQQKTKRHFKSECQKVKNFDGMRMRKKHGKHQLSVQIPETHSIGRSENTKIQDMLSAEVGVEGRGIDR